MTVYFIGINVSCGVAVRVAHDGNWARMRRGDLDGSNTRWEDLELMGTRSNNSTMIKAVQV